MSEEDKSGILESLDQLLQSNRATSLVYSGLVKILRDISEKIQPKFHKLPSIAPMIYNLLMPSSMQLHMQEQEIHGTHIIE
ncbi:hypothetical protein COZ40_03275 [Candidatus Roizmanbacteria bacterium CG_4_10_14_3_um_filter_39_13]|uniref:Uncharacterized protein n=1 Tax=Candidatus Roizmanbacteria bacterium CG_4_10_14_3_um_filter_39_13 TaxID=1974831 RepID=A0A2M7LK29_9BACT|nr:MAG: hypothetical protein COZ40_03275 [Candidatus Roizmanbacteria bacterium CG_4_10_14_3_um_filter_39_13]